MIAPPSFPGAGKTQTDLIRTYALLGVGSLPSPAKEWVEEYIRLLENGLTAQKKLTENYKSLSEIYRVQVKDAKG